MVVKKVDRAKAAGQQPPRKPFSLVLHDGQRERLEAEADRIERSVGWVIRVAIDDYFRTRLEAEDD